LLELSKVDPSLNRKINQVFLKISRQIYESDMRNDDTRSWWPIRPPLLDQPLVPFLFSELIRLFKKAEVENISSKELASLFSREIIEDLQFLWPSLGWKPSNIAFEDKLFLISKLIELSETSIARENFVSVFQKLANEIKESSNEKPKNVLRVGTRLYFEYLKPLYGRLNEDWEKSLLEATRLVLTKQNEVTDPGPWGDASKEKAIRKLVRNSDFRREKEKDLEQILQGVPEVPGIAEGVVGENIIVGFTIESVPENVDAFITDIDAFKNLDKKKELEEKGVVVVIKTRNGSHQLKTGDKIWVDGTSGIVFKMEK